MVGPLAVSRSEILARFLPARLLPEPAERTERDAPMVMDVGPGTLDQLGTDLLQIHVVSGSRLHGLYVAELRLPTGTTLGLLARDGRTEAAGPETRLRVGDALVVFTPPGERQAAEDRIRAVHRSGRLARWRGDHGH